MEDTPSDVESCEDGLSEPEESSGRRERQYGPEDVKNALKVILARVSCGDKPNCAGIAREMGCPSMESHYYLAAYGPEAAEDASDVEDEDGGEGDADAEGLESDSHDGIDSTKESQSGSSSDGD